MAALALRISPAFELLDAAAAVLFAPCQWTLPRPPLSRTWCRQAGQGRAG